ncbi:MAG: hypothetical protein ABMA64_13835 [Myxococcota bacterium]
MRLSLIGVAVCFALAACAPEPLCGTDELGEDRPICTFEDPAAPVGFEYCPGDTWASSECKSCSCDSDGKVLCTQALEGCVATGEGGA